MDNKLKELLGRMGYAVENLWCVDDIVLPLDNFKKLEIINSALKNEAVMASVWDAIHVKLEEEIKENGIWLDIKWRDTGEQMLVLVSINGHTLDDESVFFQFEDLEELNDSIYNGGNNDFEYILP